MRYVLAMKGEPQELAEQCNKWGRDEYAICPVGFYSAVQCPFPDKPCRNVTDTDWEDLLYADFRLD